MDSTDVIPDDDIILKSIKMVKTGIGTNVFYANAMKLQVMESLNLSF